MSVSLGTVHASLELRLAKFKADIKEAKSELGNLETDTKRRAERIGQSLSNLGRSMTLGITAPLALAGKAALDSAVRMDQLTRSLTSLTGDSKETEKQLIRLREAARMPGLGFRELIEGTVRLQSAGVSARQAEEALRGFGNAIALAGGSKEDLHEVGVQLAQIASSGKLQGDELRIIAERVPQLRAVLKEAFGTASSEEISKFGLNMDQLFAVMTDGLGKLPQASDSARNKLDNFNEALRDLKDAVGGAFLPAVTDGLDAISKKVEEATKWFKELDAGAQEGLGKLALGGALMGPAIVGLSALSGWFLKIGDSPFFKWLIKPGTLANLGPGVVGSLMPQYRPTPEGLIPLKDRPLEPIIPGIPASILGRPKPGMTRGQLDEEFRREQQRKSMQGKVYDPFTGKVRQALPPMDVKALMADAAAEKKRQEELKKIRERAAKEAAAEAKRKAEFRDEYGSEVDIEVLERTAGKQFTTATRRAEKAYNDARKKGAREVDAQKILFAELKKITIEYHEWKAQHEDRAFQARMKKRPGYTESGIGDPTGAMFGAMGLKAQVEQQLRYKPGAVGYGPAEAKAAATEAERARLQGIMGGMGSGFAQQGASIGSSVTAIRDTTKAMRKSLRGAFDFRDDLAKNIGFEFANEFSIGFEKFFGKSNPLTRALSRTLGNLVDMLMQSLAQKMIGANLMSSLFGIGGAAAAGAAGAAGAAATGGAAAGAAGATGAVAVSAKAAGLSAGMAWTAGFGIAAAWGMSRILNSIFPGSPAGKAHLRKRFAMDPGYKSQFAAQMTGRPGGSPLINFYGAQFNNDQDPRVVATRVAWHVNQQMRANPGS